MESGGCGYILGVSENFPMLDYSYDFNFVKYTTNTRNCMLSVGELYGM